MKTTYQDKRNHLTEVTFFYHSANQNFEQEIKDKIVEVWGE